MKSLVTLIGKFQKNATEEVRVNLGSYKGRSVLDIRVYWNNGVNDEWEPGKKGLTIGVDKYQNLMDVLLKAHKYITN